jgi:hypothetical protein
VQSLGLGKEEASEVPEIAPKGHTIRHNPHTVQVDKNSMVTVSCRKMLFVGQDPTQAAQ